MNKKFKKTSVLNLILLSLFIFYPIDSAFAMNTKDSEKKPTQNTKIKKPDLSKLNGDSAMLAAIKFYKFLQNKGTTEYHISNCTDEFKPTSFNNIPENIKKIVYEPGTYMTFNVKRGLLYFDNLIADVIGGEFSKEDFFYFNGDSLVLCGKMIKKNLNKKNINIETYPNDPKKFNIIFNFPGSKQLIFKVEFGKMYNKQTTQYNFVLECSIFNFLAEFANSIIGENAILTIATYNSNTDETFVTPSNIKEISDYSFAGVYTTGVVISDGTTYIGENAFQLSKIKEITIPSSVKSINNDIFSEIQNEDSIMINYNGKQYPNPTDFYMAFINANQESSIKDQTLLKSLQVVDESDSDSE